MTVRAVTADSLTGVTLHHALIRHVELHPDRSFLESPADAGRRATYADLEALVSGTAQGLQRLGVRPGDRVAVLMDRSVQYVAAALGVQRAGAIYVPCSPLFSQQTLRHVLALTTTSWLVVDDACAEQIESAGIGSDGRPAIIGPDKVTRRTAALDEVVRPATASLPPPRDAGDIAMISFTSGTTALPKGVIFTHGNWLHCGMNLTSGLSWGPEERILHQLPLHPANGGLVVLAPSLLRGSTIVLDAPFDPATFADALSSLRISLAFVSGQNISELLAQPASAAERSHDCARMAQRLELAPGHKQKFEDRYTTTLISVYGCSETLGPVVFGSPDLPVTEGSLGRAAPGYQIGVMADDDPDRGAGPTGPDGPDSGQAGKRAGEFLVRSLSPHGLCSGYWNDPAATGQLLREGWLHSGDAVEIDEDGCVHYLGRLSDVRGQAAQILVSRKVEQLIRAEAGVADAAVMTDEASGDLVAFVAGTPEVDLAQLESRCSQAGAAGLRVIRVASISRDILGKVSRPALRALLAADSQHSDSTTGDDRLGH